MNSISTRFVETLSPRLFLSGTGSDSLDHDSPDDTPVDPPVLDVPARASNLKGSTDGTAVTLTWRDNSDNESGFTILRISKGKVTVVGTVPADTTTFTDTTPNPGNNVYLVRATNEAGKGEVSNAAPVKVAAKDKLTAPRVIKSKSLATSVLLSWDKDAGATGGYLIERSTSPDSGWEQVGTTVAGVRKFTDTGLTPKTKYYYRVTSVGATPDQTATSHKHIAVTRPTKVRYEKPEHPEHPKGDDKPVTPA